MQGQLQKLDQTFGICMEDAQISHPPEAAGQYMLEQQSQKLSAGQGGDLAFFPFSRVISHLKVAA